MIEKPDNSVEQDEVKVGAEEEPVSTDSVKQEQSAEMKQDYAQVNKNVVVTSENSDLNLELKKTTTPNSKKIIAATANVTDLESVLMAKGVISNDQLQVAKKQMSVTKSANLGEILIAMGFVTESALGEAISKSTGVDSFDLKSVVLDSRLIKKVPKDISLKYKLIPVAVQGKKIIIAIHDVYDIVALDSVKKYFPPAFKIEPVYSHETDILEIVDQYYDYEMSIDGILKEIENAQDGLDVGGGLQEGGDYKNPIVRLVDSILVDAVHAGASDIHFEPEESFLRLRYRIDGKMRQIKAFHIDYWPPVAVRLKIMSSMNIAESRKPQDGHAEANVLGRAVDFRVATQPTINGENIVMRILDKAKSLVSLDELGYSAENQVLLKKMLKKPEGVIVLTGPTGSGKTTTLYSILNFMNTVEKNIMTLEDPVEYELPMIRQSEVREGSISFSDGIKSILRQDPDVIFVGEVRDYDTASIAVRAAMTGHQVFTTLHTNNAVGVIARLADVGIKPFLLSTSLTCCIAQRLIRVLCKECKVEKAANAEECHLLGVDAANPPKIYDAPGCKKCGNAGFKGRICVSEILPISTKINEMIALEATSTAIMVQAVKEGFRSFVDDGVDKVLKGITSVNEIVNNLDMVDRL
jgi:type IV pilus assembly protein PilB